MKIKKNILTAFKSDTIDFYLLSKKLLKLLLGVLFFLVIWENVLTHIETDFNWHLRFGQDYFSGYFPHLDTYTWGYGQNWVNVEWGGSLIIWLIYSHFSYLILTIVASFIVWLTFYLSERLLINRSASLGFLVSMATVAALSGYFSVRPATWGLLFFVLLVFSLEKMVKHRLYYFWPVLFWVWSVVHGSWVMGFVTINIYIVGNIGQNILNKFFSSFPGSGLSRNIYFKIILLEIISLAIICINPYGFGIYSEVYNILVSSDFKKHIVEWLPVYVFPIFWQSLLMAEVSFIFSVILFLKNKINAAQFLLFLLIFCSSIIYRRNMMFLLLLMVPVLVGVMEYVGKTVLDSISRKSPFLLGKIRYLVILFFIVFAFFGIKIYEGRIASALHYGAADHDSPIVLPVAAVNFIKNDKREKSEKIFNEFVWGGYILWANQKDLVFIDGRGCAWKNPKDNEQSLVERYYQLENEKGGIQELERNSVKYVLLKNINFSKAKYMKPNFVDRLIFGSDLKVVTLKEPSQLEKDLRSSSAWELVFSDYKTNVWRRK